MRQKFKLQYFMILVFLAIMLFYYPRDVFAIKDGGGGGHGGKNGVTIDNAEDLDKNNSTGSKTILASSRDVNKDFVHNGFKADMAAEAFGGAGSEAANGFAKENYSNI